MDAILLNHLNGNSEIATARPKKVRRFKVEYRNPRTNEDMSLTHSVYDTESTTRFHNLLVWAMSNGVELTLKPMLAA